VSVIQASNKRALVYISYMFDLLHIWINKIIQGMGEKKHHLKLKNFFQRNNGTNRNGNGTRKIGLKHWMGIFEHGTIKWNEKRNKKSFQLKTIPFGSCYSSTYLCKDKEIDSIVPYFSLTTKRQNWICFVFLKFSVF